MIDHPLHFSNQIFSREEKSHTYMECEVLLMVRAFENRLCISKL